MLPNLKLAMAAAFACLAAGCQMYEPNYRICDVEFDESLVGTWETVESDPLKPGERIVVEPRSIDSMHGRLNPPMFPGDPGTVERRSRGYDVTMRFKEGKTQALAAYVVRAGQERLVGVQEMAGSNTDGLAPPMWVPVHWFLRLRRTGETVELSTPSNLVGWVPLVQWHEGDSAQAPPRATEAFTVSGSIDQVLEYYRAHSDEEGFWSDRPLVLRRVLSDDAVK